MSAPGSGSDPVIILILWARVTQQRIGKWVGLVRSTYA